MKAIYRLKEKSFFSIKSVAKDGSQESLRKYNMRIHKADLQMIDELAKREGVSRSNLLNKLIYRIIENFLRSFDDFAEYTLLINTVDRINGVDALENPEGSWFSDIHNHAMYAAIHHDLHNSQEKTDLYKKMMKTLQESQLKLQELQGSLGEKS